MPVASSPAAQTSFETIEAQQIVLKGKDGKVHGTLTGESLSLSDAKGNKIDISLGESAKIILSNPAGDMKVILGTDPETGVIAVGGNGNAVTLQAAKETTEMMVTSGGRKIVAAVESGRPLADLEVFDANDKRRASFGLNSNGDPRMSLYDANETRRIYGILTDDVPLLDLNDKTGAATVELFGADDKRGAGLTVNHKARTANLGIGADGKPVK